MRVFKLFKIKDGKLYSLFCDKKTPRPLKKWLTSENKPAKGLAERPGWHCCLKPEAPHLKEELKSGEKRVWAACDVVDYTYNERPESQGGTWILAKKIKIVDIFDPTIHAVPRVISKAHQVFACHDCPFVDTEPQAGKRGCFQFKCIKQDGKTVLPGGIDEECPL